MGEGAGGVDGDDADAATLLAVLAGERADEGTLAGAGGAGDTDDVRLAGVRKQLAHGVAGFGVVVLDPGEDAGESPAVTVENAFGGVGSHGSNLRTWNLQTCWTNGTKGKRDKRRRPVMGALCPQGGPPHPTSHRCDHSQYRQEYWPCLDSYDRRRHSAARTGDTQKIHSKATCTGVYAW